MRSWISTLALAGSLCFAAFLVVMFAAQLGQAQTYKVLYSFTGGTDGGGPFAGLVVDSVGNLYGTTNYGGSLACNTDFEEGCGTIFKLNQKGEHTVLHRFTGGHDQRNPYAGLIRDAAGNLYGTTAGRFVDGAPPYGTVFQLGTTNKLSVLYTFQGGSLDGAFCTGGLVRDAEGNFYGVTNEGGEFGFGTVFKLDKSGKETILYSFGNPPDAEGPLYETLALDSNGNLYGTTFDGGTFSKGTVFKLNIATGKEQVLYNFANGTDGGLPASGLVIDKDGNIYGTTSQGGGAGAGTIFKISPDGQETIIYLFTGTDGVFPMGTLARDAQGNFYGATLFGGPNGFGTVFKVTPAGQETTLHTFNYSDGAYPWGGVIMDSKGNLYGTTSVGGTFGFGTVYKITLPFNVGDYSISGTQTLSGVPGAQATASLTLNSLSSYAGEINATCDATALPGAMCSLSPSNPLTVASGGTTNFTASVNIPKYATPGTYNIKINTQDTTGTPSHSVTLALTVAQEDFTVTSSTPSQTVKAGQTSGPYNLAVQPVGSSFGAAVTLSCTSGLPAQAQCLFSPSGPVTPGSSVVDVVMSISTKGSKSARNWPFGRTAAFYGMWLLLPGIVVGGTASGRLFRKRALRLCFASAILLPLVLSLPSCAGGAGTTTGGGTSSGTPVSYQITVTGTSPGTPPDAGQSVIVTLVVD